MEAGDSLFLDDQRRDIFSPSLRRRIAPDIQDASRLKEHRASGLGAREDLELGHQIFLATHSPQVLQGVIMEPIISHLCGSFNQQKWARPAALSTPFFQLHFKVVLVYDTWRL